MKNLLFVLSVVGMTACNPSYLDALRIVEQYEKQRPYEFLEVSEDSWKNMINQIVVSGVVTNNAKAATYSDYVINIDFITKTGTIIGSDQHIVYEYLRPGQRREYKFKTFEYGEAANVKVTILRTDIE